MKKNLSWYAYFLMTLYLYSLPGHGGLLLAERGPEGEILLYGNSCEEIKIQMDALASWSRRYWPEDAMTLPSPTAGEFEVKGASYSCKGNLEAVLPKFLLKIYGMGPQCDGPNCFNLALFSSKILHSLLYTTSKELSFWMKSPYCREKTLEEPIHPGDIIAIRSRRAQAEIHAFTYITKDLSLSKNGYPKNKPYVLSPTQEIFRVYGVPEGCERQYQSSTQCPTYGNVYSCEPPPQIVHSLQGDLSEVNCQLEELIWQGPWEEGSIRTPRSKGHFEKSFQQILEAVSRNPTPNDHSLFWEGFSQNASSSLYLIKNLPSTIFYKGP